VAVLSDQTRRSPFLDELSGVAPIRPPAPERRAVTAERKPSERRAPAAEVPTITAEQGRRLRVLGGYEGTVEEVDARVARLRVTTGGTLTVRYGERVEHEGQKAALAPPAELWGAAASAESLLRAWRTQRSKADGKPPYIVLSDAHLRGIALARPATAADLLACDGIGPTKLERYGDEILAQLDQVET
jgi:superfamily II DNA helicase RecQ